MSLHKDRALEIMIEYIYEEESSRSGWDSSFIESVRNSYYEKGGLTDKQLQIIQKRYKQMNEGESRYGRNQETSHY